MWVQGGFRGAATTSVGLEGVIQPSPLAPDLGLARSGTNRPTRLWRPPKRPFENGQQTHIPVSASEDSTSQKPMTKHSRASGRATLEVSQ